MRRGLAMTWLVAGMALGQTADWPQFGGDAAAGGVNRRDLARLTRRQIRIDGTVDASAIYLHGVTVNGSAHDVFFVTTTYGKTIAIDGANGDVLWEFTPPQYSDWAGTAQITTSTPAADPDRQNIYAAAPDGNIRKLAIATGAVVWTTAITLLPQYEKVASPLKVFHGNVIAVTGGY